MLNYINFHKLKDSIMSIMQRMPVYFDKGVSTPLRDAIMEAGRDITDVHLRTNLLDQVTPEIAAVALYAYAPVRALLEQNKLGSFHLSGTSRDITPGIIILPWTEALADGSLVRTQAEIMRTRMMSGEFPYPRPLGVEHEAWKAVLNEVIESMSASGRAATSHPVLPQLGFH